MAFAPCYERKIVVDADGLALDVIGFDCFKANKSASGRPKDLIDLETLGGLSREPPE